MEITFLGTGSMVPTKQRNVVAHFLDNGILVDCGEGTQRQMNIAGINRLRIKTILITHWHGDHVSGLIGLLQTIGNAENPPDIKLYGPKGTSESIKKLMEATLHNSKLNLKATDLAPKGVETFHKEKDYELQCAPMKHPVPTIAYSYVEKDQRRIDMKKAKKYDLPEGPLIGKLKAGKTIEHKGKKITPEDVSYIQEGKKITFILDTAPNPDCAPIAENSDLLICEATFMKEHADRAHEFLHMTAEDAATIAKEANAKKLILTHFSQRYTRTDKLVAEAKEIFKNTTAAEDFMKAKV